MDNKNIHSDGYIKSEPCSRYKFCKKKLKKCSYAPRVIIKCHWLGRFGEGKEVSESSLAQIEKDPKSKPLNPCKHPCKKNNFSSMQGERSWDDIEPSLDRCVAQDLTTHSQSNKNGR